MITKDTGVHFLIQCVLVTAGSIERNERMQESRVGFVSELLKFLRTFSIRYLTSNLIFVLKCSRLLKPLLATKLLGKYLDVSYLSFMLYFMLVLKSLSS